MKNEHIMRVYLEKKFLFSFRLLMFFAATFFLWPIYDAFNDGYVVVKGVKRLEGQESFYSYLIKEAAIAAMFIWLGTGGVREKKDSDKTE